MIVGLDDVTIMGVETAHIDESRDTVPESDSTMGAASVGSITGGAVGVHDDSFVGAEESGEEVESTKSLVQNLSTHIYIPAPVSGEATASESEELRKKLAALKMKYS